MSVWKTTLIVSAAALLFYLIGYARGEYRQLLLHQQEVVHLETRLGTKDQIIRVLLARMEDLMGLEKAPLVSSAGRQALAKPSSPAPGLPETLESPSVRPLASRP